MYLLQYVSSFKILTRLELLKIIWNLSRHLDNQDHTLCFSTMQVWIIKTNIFPASNIWTSSKMLISSSIQARQVQRYHKKHQLRNFGENRSYDSLDLVNNKTYKFPPSFEISNSVKFFSLPRFTTLANV